MIKILLPLLFANTLLYAQDTLRYTILFSGKPSGTHWVYQKAPNSYLLHYEFNDRGRGPAQDVVLKTDATGLTTYRTITGVDYFKVPVDETFEIVNNIAQWKSSKEQGEKKLIGKALYSPIHATPAEIEWMLKSAWGQKDYKLDVLPSGFLQAKRIRSHIINLNGLNQELTLYSFIGSGGPPSYAWFTSNKGFFATVSSWISVVQKGYEDKVEELYEAQKLIQQSYFEVQSHELTEVSKTPVAFKHVTLFDAITGKNLTNQTVIVENGRIAAVGKSTELKIPLKAKIIEGAGKVLMPGLGTIMLTTILNKVSTIWQGVLPTSRTWPMPLICPRQKEIR